MIEDGYYWIKRGDNGALEIVELGDGQWFYIGDATGYYDLDGEVICKIEAPAQ